MSKYDDQYRNHIAQIEATVRAHGVRKAYDMLHDQIGGSRNAFVYFCRDNGIKSRPRGQYGVEGSGRRRKPVGSLAEKNAEARSDGLTYGQKQAQEWCKAHPLTRKVVPFRTKN